MKKKEKLYDNITLKGGYIPTKLEGEELQKFLQERKRGGGSHKSIKDFKRQPKHRKKGADY